MASLTRCFSRYRNEQCTIAGNHHPGNHIGWSYTWTKDQQDAPWMEAGRAVVWAYEALEEATTIRQQGEALRDLADAVNDMATFITEFDVNFGLNSIQEARS